MPPEELNPSQYGIILDQACVPEHSIQFMTVMSGGRPLLQGPYLFLHADEWLLAVGYPLHPNQNSFCSEDFYQALLEVRNYTKANACWAICPELPKNLRSYCVSQDEYLTLTALRPVPKRLAGLANQAASRLTVEKGTTFTAGHRRLWAEFTSRVALPPNVHELYARTEYVLPLCPDLVLLNAWDQHGNLAACLLLDTAPRSFLSYMLGAHSRQHYIPYASDLLFREMLQLARDYDKDYLHLGLGVNPGIRRFKTKWGAMTGVAYKMAKWREKPSDLHDGLDKLMRTMAYMPSVQMTRAQHLNSFPAQRPFRMLWELEKKGSTSWIGGTAHFFCYSFENSLRRLFARVDTVIFEGPLNQNSLDHVAKIGRTPDAHSPRLIDVMTEEEILNLERVVCGPRGFWAKLLHREHPNPPDVRYFLSQTRHWMAFFSLWTHFLRRHDWNHSVDLEAWRLARELGKKVLAMEAIDEQISALESIPVERIVRFFRQCGHWRKFIRMTMRAYLKGDLESLKGTSAEFPSRTDMVIDRRDTVLLERMLPHIEVGQCAVFVGSAHMFNLQNMLAQAEFSIHKLRKI